MAAPLLSIQFRKLWRNSFYLWFFVVYLAARLVSGKLYGLIPITMWYPLYFALGFVKGGLSVNNFAAAFLIWRMMSVHEWNKLLSTREIMSRRVLWIIIAAPLVLLTAYDLAFVVYEMVRHFKRVQEIFGSSSPAALEVFSYGWYQPLMRAVPCAVCLLSSTIGRVTWPEPRKRGIIRGLLIGFFVTVAGELMWWSMVLIDSLVFSHQGVEPWVERAYLHLVPFIGISGEILIAYLVYRACIGAIERRRNSEPQAV